MENPIDAQTKKIWLSKLYIARARANGNGTIESYPLKCQGYWRVLSARKEDGPRTPIRYVQGTFAEAIGFAVSQPEFYSPEIGLEDPSSSYSGKIERVNAQKLAGNSKSDNPNSSSEIKFLRLEEKGLADLVKNSDIKPTPAWVYDSRHLREYRLQLKSLANRKRLLSPVEAPDPLTKELQAIARRIREDPEDRDYLSDSDPEPDADAEQASGVEPAEEADAKI